MGLKILSFFIESVTWRVAKTAQGYFHHGPTEVPEWKPGIPSGVTLETVESTFRQFPSDNESIIPHHIRFKTNYRIGRSNTECFIFISPEGDQFCVKIPPATFGALQADFPAQSLPRMRVARITIEQALLAGFPEVELIPGSSLYETVKAKISSVLPQKV